jgi:hypothetical protein
MRLLTSFPLTAFAVALLACTHAPEPALSDLPEPALSDLPDLFDYKVDPYIRMAVALQSMDRSAALNKLHAMVREGSIRVIVLARMLFVPRPGADLERPEGVNAHSIDDTRHWPQWPIEVVDGVPFLIAMPYDEEAHKWVPDAEEKYLQYCETHGDWSPFHYSVRTKQQELEALAKLFKLYFGQLPAEDEREVEFLKDQIE